MNYMLWGKLRLKWKGEMRTLKPYSRDYVKSTESILPHYTSVHRKATELESYLLDIKNQFKFYH